MSDLPPPAPPLPPPQPFLARPITEAVVQTTKRPTGWWVLIASGGALVVGAFLPWIEAVTVFGTITRSGVSFAESDALLTAGIGAGLGAAGIGAATGYRPRVWLQVVVIAAAVIALAILIYDYSQVKDRADSLASEVATASVGAGLWLSLAGAVVGVIGAALSRS